MKISCDCGAFEADLVSFPKHTTGRLVCYCKDCQSYVERLGRTDVLDDFGGTEVVVVYPKNIEILEGSDNLICYRLTKKGTYRWATTCCNSPIANMTAGFPWVGVFHSAFARINPEALSGLGEVRGRIYGRDARPGAPFRIAEKIGLRNTLLVMPFIINGKLRRMADGSPFFREDGVTPISEPVILSEKIRNEKTG